MPAAILPTNASGLILFPDVPGLDWALGDYLSDMRTSVRFALEEIGRRLDPAVDTPEEVIVAKKYPSLPEGQCFPLDYEDRLRYLRVWLAEKGAPSGIADLASMEALKLRKAHDAAARAEQARARFDRRTIRFYPNGNLSVTLCGRPRMIKGGSPALVILSGKPAGYIVKLDGAWGLDVPSDRAIAAVAEVPEHVRPAVDLPWTDAERAWFAAQPVQDQTLIAARLANSDDEFRKMVKLQRGREWNMAWNQCRKEIDKCVQYMMKVGAPQELLNRMYALHPDARWKAHRAG